MQIQKNGGENELFIIRITVISSNGCVTNLMFNDFVARQKVSLMFKDYMEYL